MKSNRNDGSVYQLPEGGTDIVDEGEGEGGGGGEIYQFDNVMNS